MPGRWTFVLPSMLAFMKDDIPLVGALSADQRLAEYRTSLSKARLSFMTSVFLYGNSPKLKVLPRFWVELWPRRAGATEFRYETPSAVSSY